MTPNNEKIKVLVAGNKGTIIMMKIEGIINGKDQLDSILNNFYNEKPNGD